MSQLDKINQSVKEAVTAAEKATSTSGVRTKKVLGEAAGKFPAYGDPTPVTQKMGSISLKNHSEQLLKKDDVRETVMGLPLQFLPYVNIRYTMEEIKTILQEKYPIVANVYAYGGQVMAELDKHMLLKTPEVEVIADLGKNSLDRHINFDAIPSGLTALTQDRKLKYYEDKFGFILNLRMVVANLVVPKSLVVDDITYNEEEKHSIIMSIISKCKVATDFTKETVDAVIEFTKLTEDTIWFVSTYKNFIWSSLNMSIEEFKFIANNAIKHIDAKSTVVFKPLANILKNADKTSAKSKALIKSKTVAYDHVPVIRLSSQYMTGAKGGNRTLYSGQYLTDRIADKRIIKLAFNELVNENVIIMADDVSGVLYLIPDLFKMLQFAMLRTVSTNNNGEYVFNPLITTAIRVSLVVEEGDIRIMFTA